MDSYLSLNFAGLLLTYFLRVVVGYVACAALDRLLRKPQHRFALWISFLVGAAGYWVALLISNLSAVVSGAGRLASVPAKPIAHEHRFVLPAHWAPGVTTAEQIFVLLYFGGLLLLTCAGAWNQLRLRLLLRHANPPSLELNSLFLKMRRDFGLKRGELLVLPGINSPATAFSWSPRVLLPEACGEMGATPQMTYVLYHELVHILRRDYFWAGISNFICGILFFHPAAHLARRRLRLQRELACDLAVVEARPEHRAEYADSLAHFVRLRILNRGTSSGVDFAASASFLGTRIRSILAEPSKLPLWKKFSQATAGAVLVAAFGLLCPALGIVLDYSQAKPTTTDSRAPVTKAKIRGATTARHFEHSRRAGETAMRDSLTSLRVHDRVPETPAFRLTSEPSANETSASEDLDKPAWRESGGARSPAAPSLRSIVLSTIGAIAGAERGERRGHDHDDHWAPSNSSPQ